jgi:hypothetical protein
MGEFRRHKDDANPGHMIIELWFPAANLVFDRFYPTSVAITALNNIMNDKVKEKYHLYSAGTAYLGWASTEPTSLLYLITGRPELATEALEYALSLFRAPETLDTIGKGHSDNVGRMVAVEQVRQPTVQQLASWLNHIDAIGAPLLSPHENIERYRKVSIDQVLDVVEQLNTGPMFLNLRAHVDALNALPSIDVIDSWRVSPPSRAQTVPASRKATFDHP